MTAAALILAFVTLQRLAELVVARRNTAALLARGAYEVAPGHYPLIVAVMPAGSRPCGGWRPASRSSGR
jgi:methyltransferase